MDTFLTQADKARIAQYELYTKIFLGEHFDAFASISKDFNKDYKHLQYITANFGGLLSKVSADMLFEEFPQFSLPKEGDKDFFSEMFSKNHLEIQFYESGLEQSYNADVVFRIRAEAGQLIIEDINPAYWFPEINENNVRAEPFAHNLKWKVKLKDGNGKDIEAVFIERHTKGKIEYKLYQLDGDSLGGELEVGAYIKQPDGTPYPSEVNTKVNDFLIIHIPNFRTNSKFFAISDYKDLISLMFAVNNRFTAVDTILNKHGEPILAVPQGVLDDNGKVNRKKFGVIEVDNTQSNGMLPTYIVWDAKLESAFSEIDKLVDLMLLMSDTSKSLFGLDEGGVAESGRALKYKLLRTIAKKHRKELYYDVNIKRLTLVAQEFAKANNLKVKDRTLQGKPVEPVITWQDGVINDALEQLEIEEKKLDLGLTTKAESIATIDGIEEDEALEKLKKIQKEKADEAPQFSAKPMFTDPKTGKQVPPNQNQQPPNNGSQPPAK